MGAWRGSTVTVTVTVANLKPHPNLYVDFLQNLNLKKKINLKVLNYLGKLKKNITIKSLFLNGHNLSSKCILKKNPKTFYNYFLQISDKFIFSTENYILLYIKSIIKTLT